MSRQMAVRKVTNPVSMTRERLKTFIPVKPNWANGELIRTNSGLAQWFRKSRGCKGAYLAKR